MSIYPFWTKDQEETPIRILQSAIPMITVNIYPGSPYPELDYTELVERRIKRDVQGNVAVDALIAGQIQDKE